MTTKVILQIASKVQWFTCTLVDWVRGLTRKSFLRSSYPCLMMKRCMWGYVDNQIWMPSSYMRWREQQNVIGRFLGRKCQHYGKIGLLRFAKDS